MCICIYLSKKRYWFLSTRMAVADVCSNHLCKRLLDTLHNRHTHTNNNNNNNNNNNPICKAPECQKTSVTLLYITALLGRLDKKACYKQRSQTKLIKPQRQN